MYLEETIRLSLIFYSKNRDKLCTNKKPVSRSQNINVLLTKSDIILFFSCTHGFWVTRFLSNVRKGYNNIKIFKSKIFFQTRFECFSFTLTFGLASRWPRSHLVLILPLCFLTCKRHRSFSTADRKCDLTTSFQALTWDMDKIYKKL